MKKESFTMNNAVSKHSQVRQWIEDRLKDQVYLPGDRLPGEAALAEDLGVSSITVRQAYEDLEKNGAVVRVPYKGTYVAEQNAGSSRAGSGPAVLVLAGHTPDWKPEGDHGGRYRQQKILESFERKISAGGGHCCIRHLVHKSGVKALEADEKGRYAAAFLLADSLSAEEQTDIALDLKSDGIPMVASDYTGSVPICRVEENLSLGVELALDHLAALGHHSVGFLTFDTFDTWGEKWLWLEKRLQAYTTGCRQRQWENGAKIWSVALPYVRQANEIARVQDLAGEELGRVFSRDEGLQQCTALIGVNDRVCLGFRKTFCELAGGDADGLSLIGFDNIIESQTESLTTVVSPAREMGEGAAGMVLGFIAKGNDRNIRTCEYAPSLLGRGSSARPVIVTRKAEPEVMA